MRLAVISHTEHYKDAAGALVGWGPTISELNHLAPHFELIYHIAPLHKGAVPPSSLPYTQDNIIFVPLEPTGGASMRAKLSILWQLPNTLRTVAATLKKVDAFQLRTPTGIGVYLIPYLTLFSKKKGWYKYAGNWKQQQPPLGYALQRWMLKNQRRKVTINGAWADQPAHCYTFENPCLTKIDRRQGAQLIEAKEYHPPFTFCFVGRLEDAKGVQRILDALAGLQDSSFIKEVHFIGHGAKAADYQQQASQLDMSIQFHGFLDRTAVFKIYRQSHFVLLPSASEGFPKVIAEAMNFGCIPIVSNVSSIGHYIGAANGFLIEPNTALELKRIVENLSRTPPADLAERGLHGYKTSASFTFSNYNTRILNEILES